MTGASGFGRSGPYLDNATDATYVHALQGPERGVPLTSRSAVQLSSPCQPLGETCCASLCPMRQARVPLEDSNLAGEVPKLAITDR